MTKAEIIDSLAKDKFIEKSFRKMKICQGETKFNLDDLAQDLYFDLLSKPEELIQSLWESGEYKFYIARMIVNNICSSTSMYDKTYRRKITMPESVDGYDKFE